MEGKALVPDLSFPLLLLEKLRGSDGLEIFPFLSINPMHQIKINMVCLKLRKLIFQKILHLLTVMNPFCRHLRRNRHLIPVAILKGLPQNDL